MNNFSCIFHIRRKIIIQAHACHIQSERNERCEGAEETGYNNDPQHIIVIIHSFLELLIKFSGNETGYLFLE